MGATAVLGSSVVDVEPGQEAYCDVRVRNDGYVVDRFTFEARGEAAPWITFDPPSIKLNPGDLGTTRARFAPPRSPSSRSGEVSFAIKVTSSEDPDGSVAEEGVLEVGAFRELSAELVPRTSRGRTRGRFEVALDNRGNRPVTADLVGVDPDNLLSFRFSKPVLVAVPGAAAFAKGRAEGPRAFLRGAPVSHPFEVLLDADDGEPPLHCGGTFVQQALLPAWLPRALMGLAAALLIAAVLWVALLRPAIRSSATDAAKKAAEKEAAMTAAPIQAQQAAAASQIAALEKAVTGTTAVPPPPLTGTAALGEPFDGRLEATGTRTYTVPDGMILSLTDLVFENPAGDTGDVRIQRGDKTVLALRLENFRELDYHFVAPVVLTGKQVLRLTVACRNPSEPCTPAAFFSGFLRAGA